MSGSWISCRECDAVFPPKGDSIVKIVSDLNFIYCPECGGKN